MTPIEYFKLQAKNLFKDYKTQYVYDVNKNGISHYAYKPKYFDVDALVLDFDLDEQEFSLMKAQHIIAVMLEFKKWPDLLNASPIELELAKLRFSNQDKIPLADWEEHIANVEYEHGRFDAEARLHLYKHSLSVAEKEQLGSPYANYLVDRSLKYSANDERPQHMPNLKPDVQITSLPLSKVDRAEFIEAANSVFESVIRRIQPDNPKLTRELWDAGDYVDNHLTEDMLPISKDYALSLIDALLVHHVIGLATQADKAEPLGR